MSFQSLVHWLQTNKYRSLLVVFISTIWFLFNGWNTFPVGALAAILLWRKSTPLKKLLAFVAIGTLIGFVGTGPTITLTIEQRGSEDTRFYFGVGGQLGTLRLAKYLPHRQMMIVYTSGIEPEKIQAINTFADAFFSEYNKSDFSGIIKGIPYSQSEYKISEDELRQNMYQQFQSMRKETGAITKHNYQGYEHVDYQNNVLPDGYLSALYSTEFESGAQGYAYLTARIIPQPVGFGDIRFYHDDLIVKVEERK